MKMCVCVMVGAAAVATLGALADASIVRANTATASSQFNSNYAPSNTINGSGLGGLACPGTPHAAYAVQNHWTNAGSTNPVGQHITWGFNTPQTLSGIHIWNHQSTTPHANNPFYEVTLFDLEVRDSANAVVFSMVNHPMLPDTATAQFFSFGGTLSDVKSVKFTVKQTQGSTNYTGLAEVLFESPLPELADLNADGSIDTVDLVRFLGLFGRPTSTGGPGDFNSDGVIDTADLVYFLGRFGQAC